MVPYEKRAAVILGGHINGFNIVRELVEEGVDKICLIDYPGGSIARFSNKVDYLGSFDGSKESLLEKLLAANKAHGKLVVFPTDDNQLILLKALASEIKEFCFIPFNLDNLHNSLDKLFQYKACDKIGVPYPKSFIIKNKLNLCDVNKLSYPLIIKPAFRPSLNIDVFRLLVINNEDELLKLKNYIHQKVNEGVVFLLSEFIPGDDTNIYAYTCYRNKKGKILGEWIGKKLTQHPDIGGVFSSASNEAPEDILKLGRDLVSELNCFGICEPEFKYDPRDNKFKLMEINLRSMMWHRVGYLSGVKLHKLLLDDSMGLIKSDHKVQRQIKEKVHLVYFTHELSNLLARKGYFRHFYHNIFGCVNRDWSIFTSGDYKPFLFGVKLLLKRCAGACLKRLKIR